MLYGAADAATRPTRSRSTSTGSAAYFLAGRCWRDLHVRRFSQLSGGSRGNDALRRLLLLTAFTAVTAGSGRRCVRRAVRHHAGRRRAHAVAIGLVLACVVPLAPMQQRPYSPVPRPNRPTPTPAGARERSSWRVVVVAQASDRCGAAPHRTGRRGDFACLAVAVCSLVMFGLLYQRREYDRSPPARGPGRVTLASARGFDRSPWARFVVGLAAGAVLGTALSRASGSSRAPSRGDPRIGAPDPGVRRLLRARPGPAARRGAPESRLRNGPWLEGTPARRGKRRCSAPTRHRPRRLATGYAAANRFARGWHLGTGSPPGAPCAPAAGRWGLGGVASRARPAQRQCPCTA